MMSAASPQIVLIIEDEPLQRMMLADLAEDAGFDTVEAMDADDAVRILETRLDIRIVLTDIDMPGGIDGLKLAVLIRDRWPPIELIIISGRRDPPVDDIPTRAVYFSKPYRRERLIEAMQSFTEAR